MSPNPSSDSPVSPNKGPKSSGIKRFGAWMLKRWRIWTIILIWVGAGFGFVSTYEQRIPSLGDLTWNYPEDPNLAYDTPFQAYITYAGNHMEQLVKFNGEFYYQYDFMENEYKLDYNYLRHWGCAYAMLYWNNICNDPDLLKAARRACDWGLKYFHTFPENDSIGYVEHSNSASSGGMALAIMALTQYAQTTGDDRYAPYIEKLGNYLLWAQEPTGRIKSYYHRSGNYTYNEDISFYIGESLLAFVLMYEYTDSPIFHRAIEKAYHFYQYRENYDYYESPFVPWATSAFAQMALLTENATYAQFAFKLLDYKLRYQVSSPTNDSLGNNIQGGMYSNPTIGSSSTWEGLGDCYGAAVLFNDTTHITKYYQAMKIGMEFCLGLQMRQEECEQYQVKYPSWVFGGFRHDFARTIETHPDGDAFNSTMRNDYTQHTLSSMTKVIEYFPLEFQLELEIRD